MKTRKLYDEDSHMSCFEAEVISCRKEGKRYQVVLDATAFFPEGGGQAPDKGTLGGRNVLDVQETPEGIVHTTDGPLEEGTRVEGILDWNIRFSRMQAHSGEHIFSGVVHREYGLDNVGFHMGEDGMTIDFNGELDAEQIARAEKLANEAVWRNVPITAEYPAPEVLAQLDYRSKLDLTEDVRIVTIQGVDCCACCAPHVSHTGEIGVIKVLDFMRHRGGVRIRLKCGEEAFADFCLFGSNISEIGAALSVPPQKTAQAVNRVNDQLAEIRKSAGELQRELIREKLNAMEPVEGNRVLFETALDAAGLRDLVTGALEKTTGICAGFLGSEKTGFRYAIGSRTVDLKAESKIINEAVHGKGGGSKEMMQGTASCTRREIRFFFLGE